MQVRYQMFTLKRRNILVNNAQLRFNQAQLLINKLRCADSLLVDVFHPLFIVNLKELVQNVLSPFWRCIVKCDIDHRSTLLIQFHIEAVGIIFGTVSSAVLCNVDWIIKFTHIRLCRRNNHLTNRCLDWRIEFAEYDFPFFIISFV